MFLGIVSQDPSDSKSNRLHVQHLPVSLSSSKTYSTKSSKTINKFPKVLNFNQLFLETQPIHLQLTTHSSRTYSSFRALELQPVILKFNQSATCKHLT